ncbi:MAG: hypothetical protein MK297_06830 [Planctomycetes bacterium]|nr:hypothetical protein [Planctomycetota bacterium]
MSGASSLARRLRRRLLTRSLEGLVEWERLDQPKPGYTIVIGCVTDLAGIALANLRALERCDLSRCQELLLVFDRPLSEVHVLNELPERVGGTPVRVMGYSSVQARKSRRIGWGWVYSWLSWSIGVGAAETRAVCLHDLDAMPLAEDLFERLFDEFERSGVIFQGVRPYSGNGFVEADRFVTTYEMFLDAEVLRERARAIEAFSRFGKRDGDWVDYDTFLYLEERLGGRHLFEVDPEELFHPSQLLCQYTDHLNEPERLPLGGGNLSLLAYLLHVGGDSAPLEAARRALETGATSVPVGPKELDLAALPSGRLDWQETQVQRLESFLYGGVRPEVSGWLAAMRTALSAAGTKS